MSKLQFNVLALILLSGISASVVAAVNPTTAGVTSQGSMGLSLTLGSEVQISNLQDIGVDYNSAEAGTGFLPGRTVNRTASFCVYSTAANGAYYLSVHSANGESTPGQYKMLSVRENASDVPVFSYNMQFTPASGTGIPTITGQDQVYGPFDGSTVPNCANSGNNAALNFKLSKEYAAGPEPGTLYSDTLSITVTPA